MTASPLGFADVAYQGLMVRDRVRLAAYAQAIRATVRPGDVVVDVGTGTGILACLAARAGARRVLAIEFGPTAELARRVVAQNGLASVVEVIHADAREAAFPEPPTVIVSETLGCLGIDEEILDLLTVVSRRCAPDVRVIPRRVDIELALVQRRATTPWLGALDDVEGIDLGVVRQRLRHRVVTTRLTAEDLGSPAATAGAFPIPGSTDPEVLTARLTASADGSLCGMAGWFRAELAPGIVLTNAPDAAVTHWEQLYFPVDPDLPVSAGDLIEVEIRPRQVANTSLWAWTVHGPAGQRAGDSLLAGAESKADLLAHLGIRPKPKIPDQHNPRLDAWAAILAGDFHADVAVLAGRLLAALPDRYANLRDARQEVMALLHAAEADG